MGLFGVLQTIAPEVSLTIHPVHINHHRRPGAAEEDQAFVEAYCQAQGLSCRTFSFDCPALAKAQHLSSEEVGRNVRYQAFGQVAAELMEEGISPDAIRIAVAQQADDRAETVLFRLLRGTGPDGLAGIAYRRRAADGTWVIRPLLDVYRKDILAYLEARHIPWREDLTNQEPLYARNRIRNQLMPYLENQYNPAVKEALNRLAMTALEDRAYLQGEGERCLAAALLSREAHRLQLDGDQLRGLATPIRRRAIGLALKQLGLLEDVGFAHFAALDRILIGKDPSAEVTLPRGFYGRAVYGDLELGRQSRTQDVSRAGTDGLADAASSAGAAKAPGETMTVRILEGEALQAFRESLQAPKGPGRMVCMLDYQALQEELGANPEQRFALRERRPGDWLALPGTGRKKIQDLLVDQKVPRGDRERVRVLGIGSQVFFVWMPERRPRFSGKFVVGNETKSAVYIEFFGLT